MAWYRLSYWQKRALAVGLVVSVVVVVMLVSQGEQQEHVLRLQEKVIKPRMVDKNSAHFPAPYAGPQNDRQRAVVAAFKHAWSAYKKYAWGHDELQADTKDYHELYGLGLTLLDSLDTMYIMGLADEFHDAREWVADKLTFDIDKEVNLFETTIRALGGLMSTYHLTGDGVFLKKSRDLADRLLAAFNQHSHVPYSDVNLRKKTGHTQLWSKYSVTAEIGTLQLEFTDLSQALLDFRYQETATSVTEHILDLPNLDGLVPIYIDPITGQFKKGATVSVGSKGDSYYEYLLKMWIQTGKKNDRLRDAYLAAVAGMKKHLMKESQPSKLLFVGELFKGSSYLSKMDHLTCYLSGLLVLGYQNGLDESHLELAEKLADTCHQMYAMSPTFLSPEKVYFNTNVDAKEDFFVKMQDRFNLQRPEFIESLFYLYRVTKNQKYRDWGWQIFQAFEKYTKLPEGYTAINNVMDPDNVGHRNKMETYFLGETLKYFYLLFSDDASLLPLDKFVFNTEAHPLPVHEDH